MRAFRGLRRAARRRPPRLPNVLVRRTFDDRSARQPLQVNATALSPDGVATGTLGPERGPATLQACSDPDNIVKAEELANGGSRNDASDDLLTIGTEPSGTFPNALCL